MPPSGGKPFQSKLIPFTDAIRSWRRQGKSYAEIVRLLAGQGMSASPSTVFAFVKVRSRPRHPVTMLEASPSPARSAASHAAIETLKRKPPAPAAKPVFRFDETKPLTLQSE